MHHAKNAIGKEGREVVNEKVVEEKACVEEDSVQSFTSIIWVG
jgi:hypothetical protein